MKKIVFIVLLMVFAVRLNAQDRLPVITIHTDRQTSYEAYFKMQNAIVGAYSSLREAYAQKHFGKHYKACNAEERTAINDYYPQRISEDLKGGEP